MGRVNFIKGRRDLYQVFYVACKEFYQDDGFNLAAGLSFFAVLSVIPLALIVTSVFGHLLGQQEQLIQSLNHWVQVTLPGAQPEFLQFLRQLIDKKVSTGWIGMAFLFFVASLMFANIEHTLDRIFKNSKKRNFWHSRAFAILLIFFTAFFFFVPAQLNFFATHLPTEGSLPQIAQVLTGDFGYFLAHGVIFFLLLNVVPNQSMPKKKIVAGAVLFASLTVLARQVFQWYMGVALDRYTFIYGSLTLLVVMILWIYYLSLIFIFCSEVVNALQQIYPRRPVSPAT